jgi:hypothetical protein
MKERKAEYALQLSCYRLATQKGALGEICSPEIAVADLNQGEIIALDFQAEAENTIIDTGRKIQREEFPALSGFHCKRCDYEGFCAVK